MCEFERERKREREKLTHIFWFNKNDRSFICAVQIHSAM